MESNQDAITTLSKDITSALLKYFTSTLAGLVRPVPLPPLVQAPSTTNQAGPSAPPDLAAPKKKARGRPRVRGDRRGNLWDIDRVYLERKWLEICNDYVDVIGHCWVAKPTFGRGLQVNFTYKGKYAKCGIPELGLFIEKSQTKRSVSAETGEEIGDLRVSRRCTTPNCVKPEHHTIETPADLMMRKSCRKSGICICTGPPCIIVINK